MTSYLLAGGGTAGHVNPLLAVAERIRRDEPAAQIVVVGTAEGLESRLVPARGFELVDIPKVPFPRRLNRAALRFPAAFREATQRVNALITERGVDVVVGFGGYVSTPVYRAAHRSGVPIVVHEANSKPGLANRIGARYTRHVGVAFSGTPLPNARVVGMPLRAAIEDMAQSVSAREAARREAFATLDLAEHRPVLLVTGGSLGARRVNATIRASVELLVQAGWQVLHLVGGNSDIDDPHLEGYRQLPYLDRMELALASADVAVSRSGASTVCELSALAIPAVYVPYPVGNGEQRLNAAGAVGAGSALMVDDAAFTPSWVESQLLALLLDTDRCHAMRAAAASVAVVDGTARTVNLIRSALA